MSRFKRNEYTAGSFTELPQQVAISNARVIDNAENLNGKKSVIIEDGRITAVADQIPTGYKGEIIDGSNMVLMPGWFDMHVHFREPGREDKETIRSGSLAAANGGITGVACMPNTSPAIDSQETVQYILQRAKDSLVDVYPIAAVTKGREGKELSPLAELVEAGAVAISDDGSPVMSAAIMRRALEYSKMFDIPVLGHEEDSTLSSGGCMHEGFYSTKLGLPGIPALAEEIMISRDIMLAEYTGGKFHVCHISTAGGLELVRRAKDKGLPVTCEVAPHHFTLTDQAVESFDTNTKMNPPLRAIEDRAAMIEGLKNGTIDAIATDHAPHTIEEKEAEYIYAPFGITGLESSLGLIMSELVHKKIIPLEKLYDLCVSRPREILNLEIPKIKDGEAANLTLFDPQKNWKMADAQSYSRSLNTPFTEKELSGKPVLVINHGRIFYSK